MFEVLLINGQKTWVCLARAHSLQREGKILYIIREKELNITGNINDPFPNISRDQTAN
ncbi:MAG: hypothetical protein ACYDHW_09445 [Syntrophorhabdaceae bacterium]